MYSWLLWVARAAKVDSLVGHVQVGDKRGVPYCFVAFSLWPTFPATDRREQKYTTRWTIP